MTNEYFAAGAAAADLDLMLWLHAEAVWEREQADFEAARQERGWRNVIEAWERHMTNSVLPYTMELETEIGRLRREVEFEANGERWENAIIGPLCACVTDEQVAVLRAGGFSRPVCTVHPGGLHELAWLVDEERGRAGVFFDAADDPPASLSVLPEEKPGGAQ